MLGSDAGGKPVGSAEGDVAGLDPTGHVVGLSGRVDDLVDGLHGEVECHEFALRDRSADVLDTNIEGARERDIR